MNKKHEIGQRLRAARKAAGLNQEDVANVVGVAKSTVSEWETGKRSPDVELLETIAECLNVTIEFLFNIGSNKSVEDQLREFDFRVHEMTDDALQLAYDFDNLDDWARHFMLATMEYVIEQHRKP